ncbi:hypothetical protein ACS4RR_021165 [Rhizobium sp. Z1P35]
MDMMVPAEVRIGKVPVLGSGKVDFVAARKLAEAAVQAGRRREGWSHQLR